MAKWGGDDTSRRNYRPKEPKFLAFDLETAKITQDDIDLLAQRPLGISCAVTVATGEEPMVWQGAEQMTRLQCQRLVQYLWRSHYVDGHTIVTWNGTGFDFDVLGEESGMVETCRKLARAHIDIAFAFFCERGFMPSLNTIALGMQLESKSGHGADAPRLWAEGQRQEVLDYVRQDGRVTMNVFQEIRKRGYVRWITRAGKAREWVPSSGRLLTVREAMRLPEPNVSWMDKPWKREKFTGWLENEMEAKEEETT